MYLLSRPVFVVVVLGLLGAAAVWGTGALILLSFFVFILLHVFWR